MSEYVTPEFCKTQHDETNARYNTVLLAIRDLEARLYRDNGHLSIQTQLARQSQTVGLLSKIVYGMVTLTCISVFGAILALVIIKA
jgi:hypothetical protein